MDNSDTIRISIQNEEDQNVRETLQYVYDALKEKKYNPVEQIIGYIISEDPAYITTYKNARNKILHLDRYELLTCLIKNYLNVE